MCRNAYPILPKEKGTQLVFISRFSNISHGIVLMIILVAESDRNIVTFIVYFSWIKYVKLFFKQITYAMKAI